MRRVADGAHGHPDQLVEQQFVERIIVEQFLFEQLFILELLVEQLLGLELIVVEQFFVDRKFQLLFLVVEQQLLVEQQLQSSRVRPPRYEVSRRPRRGRPTIYRVLGRARAPDRASQVEFARSCPHSSSGSLSFYASRRLYPRTSARRPQLPDLRPSPRDPSAASA